MCRISRPRPLEGQYKGRCLTSYAEAYTKKFAKHALNAIGILPVDYAMPAVVEAGEIDDFEEFPTTSTTSG